MDNSLEEAFLRGMCKRAMEKDAFVGALAGTLFRGIVPHLVAGKATNLLTSKVLPRFMAKPGLVGRGANMVNNVFTDQGAKGMAGQIGMHMALAPLISKPIDYVADKFDGQGY